MCGIAGFWDISKKLSTQHADAILRSMIDTIAYRGPDDAGVWHAPQHGVHLGHRRLSIYDLSPNGHQPMSSHSSRYCLIFNGSIYNYQALRAELSKSKQVVWRSNTDTEVILEGFEQWGIAETLSKLTGMFAIAVFDTIEEQIYLIRDRLGEKPLYYTLQNNTLAFASELKAIQPFPGLDLSLDLSAVDMQLKYCYIPAPLSIYKKVKKLEPGHYLQINKEGQIQSHCYWDATEVFKQNKRDLSEREALDEFNSLFENIIANQLHADVPVGTFLSGGIDSSLVAMFAKRVKSNVRTYSIGIENSSYNEAENAKQVANTLGTEHHELYVQEQDALDLLPKLPEIYDEPFSDSSQIPTTLVATMAKKHVTVALTGDGGDEVFAGYNRHKLLPKLSQLCSAFPKFSRVLCANAALATPVPVYDTVYKGLSLLAPNKLSHQSAGDKIHKLARLMKCDNFQDMFEYTISQWQNPPVRNTQLKVQPTVALDNQLDFMLANDTLGYLPNDILTKVDRASMSVALETRIPFLDHHLIEFAWTLPASLKISENRGKYLLCKVLEQALPKSLIYQPKKGFGVPIDAWLRGALKPWVEDLFSTSTLRKYDFLDAKAIQTTWKKHQGGLYNYQYKLWNALMLVAWLEKTDTQASLSW